MKKEQFIQFLEEYKKGTKIVHNWIASKDYTDASFRLGIMHNECESILRNLQKQEVLHESN